MIENLPDGSRDRAQVLVTFIEAGKINPDQLRQLIDQLETIAGIQQGLAEVDAGQTRPIGDFIQDIEQNYGISD